MTTRTYIVTDANGVESRWNLNEEQAKKLDARPVDEPAEPEPDEDKPKPKTRRAPNKARRASDK